MDLDKLYEQTDTAKRMAEAATAFLAALRPDQLARAQTDFDDEATRKDWHYIPRERPGLSLKEMEAHQREKAFKLVDTGLAEQARNRVRTIISLESVLAEQEGSRRRLPRDPELYHLVVFGNPGTETTWSWRFEGHHISLNHTIVNGSMVAPTPIFFGANPARVLHGEKEGLRTLKDEEELARELLSALDGEQKKVAVITPEAPSDILTSNVPCVTDEVHPEGLSVQDMTDGQQEIVNTLIDVYITRLPEPVAAAQRTKIETAGLDSACFSWAGAEERGKGHYYRVQAPVFLAEYDCTQNGANHIHSVWRDLTNDFGDDILKRHYRRSH